MILAVIGLVILIVSLISLARSKEWQTLLAILIAPLVTSLFMASLTNDWLTFLFYAPFVYAFSSIGLLLYVALKEFKLESYWLLTSLSVLVGLAVFYLAGTMTTLGSFLTMAGYIAMTSTVFWIIARYKLAEGKIPTDEV